MSAAVPQLRQKPSTAKRINDSRAVIRQSAAHELFFAVVGPVGAGSSLVARQLQFSLSSERINGESFNCEILKAGEVIETWVKNKGLEIADELRPIDRKILMQEYGDNMREPDNAAVAVGLIERIAETRARWQGKRFKQGEPVEPDGRPRAYILDSLKNPAEAHILRRLYGDAFVLIGVVCSEPERRKRLGDLFFTGPERYRQENKKKLDEFMTRDADDSEHKNGQHVTDTFHQADFFIDNTQQINMPPSGEMKDVRDHRLIGELSRLISIITHRKIWRPTSDETAMHTAHSAKLRSSCLSRQVGAALVDRLGNVVATGTNEVPRAGGGVYGEDRGEPAVENRCAFCENGADGPFCSNNRIQNELISEAIDVLFDGPVDEDVRSKRLEQLRKTQIGALLEFSRSVHAEMDALLSAARSGVSPVGSRLFVTTFPCHFCARHIVSAGVYEVQYIEPYPKSRALELHGDAIETVPENWTPPRETSLHEEIVQPREHAAREQSLDRSDRPSGPAGGSPIDISIGKVPSGTGKVLFRPFVGVAPRLYPRVFLKDREYKNKITGKFLMGDAEWGTSWSQHQVSYAKIEAELLTLARLGGKNA